MMSGYVAGGLYVVILAIAAVVLLWLRKREKGEHNETD